MNLLSLLLCTVLMTPHIPTTRGEKLLFLSPVGSKSHKIFYMSIARALVDRGHQVTFVSSHFDPTQNAKNLRHVIVTNSDLDSVMTTVFNDTASPIRNLMLNAPYLCSDTLAQKQVQNLKKERYDLVLLSMFVSDCYLSLVHHFKVPWIYMSPAGLMEPFGSLIGNLNFPSFVPNKLLEAKFPLSFQERFLGTVIDTFISSFFNFYVQPKMESVCKERGLCPEDVSFKEIRKNVSLTIINSVRTLETPPRPVMPNVIHAGGAHVKLPKPLPKDLEDFVQGSGEHGFIFFSLGSALKPSLLPEKYRKILVEVFGSLKQRVLWRWEEKAMPDLPDNVMLREWLPQRDLLGHPKIKLFISHGGLLSTLEAMYHGVPVLGVPVFGDQFANLKEGEREGWAKVVEWKDLSHESFKTLIFDMIHDPSMRRTVKRRSEVMKDQPLPPDQEAAFWVEYVIRHEGAPHLKSPLLLLSWYEVYNMDVWLLIVGIVSGLVFAVYFLCSRLLRVCLKRGKSTGKGATNKRGKRKEE